MSEPVLIARCLEHGLHGEREECFVCGGLVEQVPMIPAEITEEMVELAARKLWSLIATVELGMDDPYPYSALISPTIEDLKRYARGALEAALPSVSIAPVNTANWEPGRWWRAIGSDGKVWAESSSEREIRERARPGDRVQQLYERHESKWVDA